MNTTEAAEPLGLGSTEGLGHAATERACETCRHVRTRAGNTWADQRCALYLAGKHAVMTWTALHDPKKCGSGRSKWAPPPTSEDIAAAEDQKARILAAGGPQASLLRHIMGRRA